MSGDAIAIFHPSDPEKLEPFLDLDEESDESEGLYAEALEDGTFLVHTFQPFDVFAENPAEMQVWLQQFADVLEDIHDDPRGLLFFSDEHEPVATTYDALIAELADKGIFCSMPQPHGVDLNALQDVAAQLLGGGAPGSQPSSFDIGQMFGNVQQHLAEALGLPKAHAIDDKGAIDVKGEVVDEEFEAPPSEKK